MSGINISDLLGLKDVALKIAELLFSRRDKLDEAHKIAREKVYLALSETKFYLADFKKGARSRDTEKNLSMLWREASVSLRKIDHDLADRCFVKMDYWAAPSEWTDADIKKAKIGFETVFKRTRQTFSSKCA
jgi:hypothetical protein